MKNYFDLTGRVAIITGCSGGLGEQMAHALANQGCTIVPIARRKEKVEAVAAEITKEYGVETLPLTCDVTNTDQIKAVVKAVLDKYGKIDILINNAGTGGCAPAEKITDEQLVNEINIDLIGTFKMAREVAAAAMIPAKYGRIINIASMYGLVGNMVPGAEASPYHAAKGGVVNLTRAFAAEWGKYGITCNSICPGYFETPLTKATLETEWFSNYAKGAIPAGRYGKAGELDTTAIYLASPMSTFVTGMNIAVDGGYTAI